MKQKLVIELSEQATKNYLSYVRKQVQGEVESCCEPSGSTISIQIAPEPYDSCVYVYQGDTFIEFGGADIKLVETN